MSRIFAGIPDPAASTESLREAVGALKQNVEVMTGQRKPQRRKSVSWEDLLALGLVTEDQMPR